MKKLLMAAVALTAVAASPALADTTSQTYTFSGSVATICTISGASTVDFGALTDSNGVYTKNGSHQDATDSNAYCNQAQTSAKISHTNMFSANAASTGFTNNIPLSAQLTTAQGVVLTDSTAASGTSSSTGSSGTIGAFTGLTVRATLGDIGANKLVAGTDYTGTITVVLTPTS